MDYLTQILERPFTDLPFTQQVLAVFIAFCLVTAAVWSVIFAARRLKRSRAHERRFVGRPVAVSWRDGVGVLCSDDAVCRDLSPGGMAIDSPFPLKKRLFVNVRMSGAKLSERAVVRRSVRSGSGYVIGLEFDRIR